MMKRQVDCTWQDKASHQQILKRMLWLLSLSLMTVNAVADELLWEKLQQEPNMVVLMRNMESDGNRDGANMLTWDAAGNCSGESTLTESGRHHAERIGQAFAQRGIRPVVISSPMCRCSETAKIAFGEYVTDSQLRLTADTDTDGEEIFRSKANTLLHQYRGKNPVVFVNHRPNIDALTMELLDIGELLIGTVSENGEIDVLGRIRLAP